MAENLIEQTENTMSIPSKFRDEKGNLNVEALLKSYLELEKKRGSMVRIPCDTDTPEYRHAFYQKLGAPASADQYKLEIKNELMASDQDVNKRLFDLGFTNRQVQAVYDLAAEKIMPVIQELAQDYEADRQKMALENHFGGKERFEQVASQISAWAKSHVDENVFNALATTYEGVMTLYKMMQSDEPSLSPVGSYGSEILDEEGLKKMMMSPRYWRDQDPAILKKVSDGFERLYPNRK